MKGGWGCQCHARCLRTGRRVAHHQNLAHKVQIAILSRGAADSKVIMCSKWLLIRGCLIRTHLYHTTRLTYNQTVGQPHMFESSS